MHLLEDLDASQPKSGRHASAGVSSFGIARFAWTGHWVREPNVLSRLL